MKKKTYILQLGKEDWSKNMINQAEEISWTFIDVDLTHSEIYYRKYINYYKNKSFSAVIITDIYNEFAIEKLEKLIDPYTLIIDRQFSRLVSPALYSRKLPIFFDTRNKLQVIETLKSYFFSGQMGAKLHTNSIAVSPGFSGKTNLLGQRYIILSGDFNLKDTLLTWQYNIALSKHQKKLWLEFSADESVNLTLVIHKIISGSSEIVETVEYSQNQIREGIEVGYTAFDNREIGYLSISLKAQGSGEIRVGPLHYRNSRSIYGEYILGGQQLVDPNTNEEIYVYFHPGDLKPPLNVYFSGYRQAEGFEGFSMMKRLGTPFILVTDPRLEGGAFYIGSNELENKVKDFIQDKLDYLNFNNHQLILSGLSMGTFGALYYGSCLEPSYIIIGKPLVNIGNVAINEKIVRPGGFPTSLDILGSHTEHLTLESAELLNKRFWNEFSKSSFNNTRFIIAFMKDDDYDSTAYHDIISSLSNTNSTVISKAISGRHNDNSGAINEWFINQYHRVLWENFGRETKN